MIITKRSLMNPISTFCGILSLVAIITQKWIIILLREKLEKCIRAPVFFVYFGIDLPVKLGHPCSCREWQHFFCSLISQLCGHHYRWEYCAHSFVKFGLTIFSNEKRHNAIFPEASLLFPIFWVQYQMWGRH